MLSDTLQDQAAILNKHQLLWAQPSLQGTAKPKDAQYFTDEAFQWVCSESWTLDN